MSKSGPGRPTLFTPKVRDAILEALRLSATYEHAAQYAGIANSTLHNWLAKGREDMEAGVQSEFLEFLTQCEKASAEGGIKALASLDALVSVGDFKAVRFLLERRFPGWQPAKPSVIVQAAGFLQQQSNQTESFVITAEGLSALLEELERTRVAGEDARILPAGPKQSISDQETTQSEGWTGPEPDFDQRAKNVNETDNLAASVVEGNPYQELVTTEQTEEVPNFMEGVKSRGGGRRKNPNQPASDPGKTGCEKTGKILDALFEKS